jgi:hypothetical protein
VLKVWGCGLEALNSKPQALLLMLSFDDRAAELQEMLDKAKPETRNPEIRNLRTGNGILNSENQTRNPTLRTKARRFTAKRQQRNSWEVFYKKTFS